MQKKGEVQKGFFFTVLLVIGALVVASFLNRGSTGDVVYQQQKEIARQDLYVEGSGTSAAAQGGQGGATQPYVPSIKCPGQQSCGMKGKLVGVEGDRDENTAKSKAIAQCQANILTEKSKVDTCVIEETKHCARQQINNKPCESKVVWQDTSSIPCSLYACVHNTLVNGKWVECEYKYDPLGNRIEPPTCTTSSGRIDIWMCGADDGTYFADVYCSGSFTPE